MTEYNDRTTTVIDGSLGRHMLRNGPPERWLVPPETMPAGPPGALIGWQLYAPTANIWLSVGEARVCCALWATSRQQATELDRWVAGSCERAMASLVRMLAAAEQLRHLSLARAVLHRLDALLLHAASAWGQGWVQGRTDGQRLHRARRRLRAV